MMQSLKDRIMGTQLKKNMLSGSAVNLLIAFSSFIIYPVYLHYLGYEIYGLWLILATVIEFAQVASIGMDMAVMKLIAEVDKNDEAKSTEYLASAIALLLATGTVVLSLVILFKTRIATLFGVGPDYMPIVIQLLPYATALSIYAFMVKTINASLAGLGRFDIANYLVAGGRLCGLVVSVVLIVMGFRISALLVGQLVDLLVGNATSIWFLKRVSAVRCLAFHKVRKKTLVRLVCFGGNLTAGSVVQMLLMPFNRIIITNYVGLSSLPIYDLAVRISTLALSLIDKAFLSLLPEISQRMKDGNRAAIGSVRRLSRRCTELTAVFSALFLIVIFLFSEELLRVWLGSSFREEIPSVVKIMAFYGVALFMARPSRYILLGIGISYSVLIGNAIQTVSNIGIILIALTKLSGSISMVCYANVLAVTFASVYYILHKMRVLAIHEKALRTDAVQAVLG